MGVRVGRVVVALGVGFLLAGVAKIYWPGALILLGGALVAAGLFLFEDDPRSSE